MPLKLRAELPSFDGVTEWVNGAVDPVQLQGKPILIHFWAVSCYMCKDGLPTLNEWRVKFEEQYGMSIIGIHMPRSEKDTDLDEVKKTIEQYELKHPIAIDNEHKVTDSFLNEFVPGYYLFDGNGQMRFYGAGEKALGMVEQRIHKILGPKEEA